MNRSIRLLSALTIGAAALAFAPMAHADETFSLHVDLGATQPLTAPQDQIYQLGPSLTARGLFNLHPWFNLGPVVEAAYLPKAIDDGSNAGVLWQGGVAFRIQRTHDLMGHDIDSDPLKSGVWSPYFNMDLTAAHTGNLWRPAMDLQVGMDVATDSRHSFWFGPYIGYTHVFQTSDTQSGQLLDPRDVNLLQAGVSFTWDYPQRERVVRERVIEQRVVRVPGETQVLVLRQQVPVPVAAPAELNLTQHVYFDFDKSVLRWESVDKLNEVVAALKKFPNKSIHVQGHASSDGQKAHNERLAAARAESVRAFLVAHGIDANRLTVDNFGIDRPAGDQKTQEGRERSRRVEFEINVTTK